jgi:hypothetical protein
MARRPSTIGANPLDAVVPVSSPAAHRRDERQQEEDPPARAAVRKERATFQLPAELIERARNAVFWTPGATMAALMEAALAHHLDRLEKARGEQFPPRSAALKTGRPVKAA